MTTRRGLGLMAVAVAFYLGARLFGTFELYLMAYGLGLLLVGSWLWAVLSGRGVTVRIHVDPPSVVAGDSLEMHVEVENRSVLPAMGCEVTLGLSEMGARDATMISGTLSPRKTWRGTRLSEPVWRGVYDLEPPACTLCDPLGLTRVRKAVGARPQVVVVPRVPRVDGLSPVTAGLVGAGGLRGSGGRGAGEFRAIRPHQPGEPLSRIHWPSTARTGSLMLRELEDAPRADGMVVLDGTGSAVIGRRPGDTFELQVELAAGLADGVLRHGKPVMVLVHGARDEFLNLEPVPADRQRLLQSLAGVSPAAAQPVGEAIARAMAHGSRALSVVVVSAGHDPGLLASLQHLARTRVGVFLIHVSASSFLGLQQALEEEKRFLVRLQSVGIPVLHVRKGDDPGAVLSDIRAAGTGAWEKAG